MLDSSCARLGTAAKVDWLMLSQDELLIGAPYGMKCPHGVTVLRIEGGDGVPAQFMASADGHMTYHAGATGGEAYDAAVAGWSIVR